MAYDDEKHAPAPRGSSFAQPATGPAENKLGRAPAGEVVASCGRCDWRGTKLALAESRREWRAHAAEAHGGYERKPGSKERVLELHEAGLNYDEIAREVGLHRTYVSKIVRGER